MSGRLGHLLERRVELLAAAGRQDSPSDDGGGRPGDPVTKHLESAFVVQRGRRDARVAADDVAFLDGELAPGERFDLGDLAGDAVRDDAGPERFLHGVRGTELRGERAGGVIEPVGRFVPKRLRRHQVTDQRVARLVVRSGPAGALLHCEEVACREEGHLLDRAFLESASAVLGRRRGLEHLVDVAVDAVHESFRLGYRAGVFRVDCAEIRQPTMGLRERVDRHDCRGGSQIRNELSRREHLTLHKTPLMYRPQTPCLRRIWFITRPVFPVNRSYSLATEAYF